MGASPSTPNPNSQLRYALYDVVNTVMMPLEKTLIQHVLRETKGNKSRAAKRLKIGYKTLYRKMRLYAID
jgi:DNA-binding NtrC family response regulator